MKISIITLFPDMFSGPFDYSIIHRAQKAGLVTIDIIQLRNFSDTRYKTADGKPYGGGIGMILRVDVIDRALASVRHANPYTREKTRVILTDPKGKPLRQNTLAGYCAYEHIILIAGHYEGVDHRVYSLIDEAVSVGPYILTGGELPAMTITDGITRLIPGVLKHPEAVLDESFSDRHRKEYPQYTTPRVYKYKRVPHVLLEGNHQAIALWKTRHTSVE